MLKKTAKYIYAVYLYHFGLKTRIEYLKKHTSVVAIYDHNPSPEKFEQYIKWLLNYGFEFISLDELLKYLNGKRNPDSCKIWFTLDDGWRGNLKLIPIIEKYQIPITLFIPTYPVETGFYRDTLEKDLEEYLPDRYKKNVKLLRAIPEEKRWIIDQALYNQVKDKQKRDAITINELKILAQHPLISIGAHTHTHPILTQCNNQKIRAEIELNLLKIERYTGFAPEILALPSGNYNKRVLESIFQTQIKHVASIKNGLILNSENKLILPRNGIAQASFYENCCRILDYWYPNVEKLNNFIKF